MESPFWPSFTKLWHVEPYPSISPTRPELSAAGKTVVVTGGATGIGLSITRAFAAAGCTRIAILARREDKLLAAKALIEKEFPGVQVLALVTDIANEKQVDASFAKIAEVFDDSSSNGASVNGSANGRGKGKIDVLVANSGFFPTPGGILDPKTDLADWWRGFETNVLGLIHVSRAFLRHSKPLIAGERGGPRIINISTGIATIPPMQQGISAYAGSKAAGGKVFDYIAMENPGLKVFNLHPGIVTTDMSRKSGRDGSDHIDLPGHFCVWLASPEADFLSGKWQWVNWDVDELKAREKEITSTPLLTTMLDGMSFHDFKGDFSSI
ncbi:NAD(P)-binding protein [Microdochium trichocladiopsis]|uniref:NAD(P)-binding protein n=1 Tax=Microdochium trichocladiopsis TaxID=1682393 RepID=A0A9P8Y7Y7_9PEZI|nr:NAD(P)-binding protein [Microdochium trichocladiopsis]KAH7030651.1 NAD(P)-binding protein [Microdochium trichocladiopsis]